MSRWAALIATLLAAVWTSPSQAKAILAEAPACELMIDASGSMDGFRKAEGQPLPHLLEALRGVCPNAYLFGDRLRRLPTGAQIQFSDQTTNLGPDLDAWAAHADDGTFLILVTDNVADNSRDPHDPTTRFYDLLRRPGSPFSHIVVMALRAPFDGALFDPRDDGRPPVPYPSVRGSGAVPRALTIYVLGKRAEARDQAFKDLRAQVGAVLARTGRRPHETGASGDYDAYAVFDVKPFAREAFQVVRQDAAIQADTRPGAGRCAAKARFDAATGTFLLVDQPMDQSCELNAILTVRFPDRWCLKDTGLSATVTVRAQDPAVIRHSVEALPVTPSRANLCAQDQKLKVGLKFDAFRFKKNLGFLDRLSRAFKGTFEAEGQLTVNGQVARRNVDLGGRVAREWSYGDFNTDIGEVTSPDPAVQRRVFRLGEMVRAVIPEEQLQSQALASYNVKIQVRYHQGPVFVLIVGILLLLALLAVLALLLGRARTYVIETDGGEEVQAAMGLFGSAGAASAGGVRLTLMNLGIMLLASSNGRILRGVLLGPSGGRIEIAPRGSAPGRRPRRTRRSDEDDYSGFGDADEGLGPAGGEPVTFRVRTIRPGRGQEDVADEDF